MTKFEPKLGLFSAITLVVGSMIGSGIFLVPSEIARLMQTPWGVLSVWVITGVLTLLGAASYSRLAAYMPKAGGQYVFLKAAWGERVAFLYGWTLLLVIQVGFLAAVAVAFSRYVGYFWPAISTTPLWGSISSEQLLSALTIVCLTAYHTTGVENGARLQNVLTSLKVLALACLTLVGLLWGRQFLPALAGTSAPIINALNPAITPAIFASACVGALFSSDSWNYVTFIGEEVKQPEKTLPKALIWGTLGVVILYVLANVAYLNLLPFDAIAHAHEDRVASAALQSLMGAPGAAVISALILVSTLGCLNGLMLAGARVFYVMAQDGLLFQAFGRLNSQTRTPNVSLWAQGFIGALLVFSGSYGMLLGYIVFGTLLFYILTVLGLFRLKQKQAAFPAFPAWWPILYSVLAGTLALFLLCGPSTWASSLIGLGLIISGLPVYAAWKKKKDVHAAR